MEFVKPYILYETNFKEEVNHEEAYTQSEESGIQ
jgi:hypothetical protein